MLPAAFDSQIVGAVMDSRTVGSETVYSASEIADPSTWAASVASRNETALVEHRLDVGGRLIDVRAWPGDDAWTAFVSEQILAGVPVLEELIGVPWPAPADGLDVIESVRPDAHGFGGWYDSTRNVIEIGDELDPQLVFHELSHLWFNGELFASRWILEGLAEEYGARVVAALGEGAPAPLPVRADAPGAVALNAWAESTVVRDEATARREQFGYNAAWSVVRAVIDEIGTEAMSAVLVAADGNLLAYRGDPPAEPMPGAADWMWFLDLLEEVGGSTQASSLFASTVVTAEQLPSLELRQGARAAYDGLEAAGEGWTPPLAVRQAMAAWNFDLATQLTQSSAAVLDTRTQVSSAVEPLGLTVPSVLEQAYENGAGDLGVVTGLARDTLEAAGHLVEADRAVDGDEDVFERIGLLGHDVDAELDAAIAAFEDGDPDAASAHAQRAERLVDDAAETGRTRAGVGAAAVVAVLCVVALSVGLSRRRRGHRRARAVPSP